MISSEARTIAARRIAVLERRLDIAPASPRRPADVGPRVSSLLLETEESDRPPRTVLRPGVVELAAGRLAGLEWRAVQAEVGWARWRGRRLFRVADVLARWAHRPWRIGFLASGLRSAMRRIALPELPERPSVESFLEELESHVPRVKPRPLPYPHLRVAHAGRISMFERVASHFHLGDLDESEWTTGFDMLLVEPGVDDVLDGLDEQTLTRFTEAGIPVLWVARTTSDLEHPLLSHADLVLVEDPELAEQATNKGPQVFHIHPSVDDTVHNPIGWKQHPQHQLMVVADHPGITSHLEILLPSADQISLHGAAIPGLQPARHTPERPTGTSLAQHAKNHRAVYATPQLAATHTSHIQHVLDLTAAGALVITPPDPTLDDLLPNGHHLTATNSAELQTHLEVLQHSPTRERHSVPARRHILTNHTRKHRFEQLLTHLEIPTNPTPRISILLATKRPENIDHALNNVTIQDWENKELILILHGEKHFDLPHIQNLTSQLPYPTTILPCPETMIFGDALNKGLDRANGTYITKMDDDDHYGPNHLTDLITAHTYSNADIVGKWGNIVYMLEADITLDYLVNREEAFGAHVPGATMLLERELLAAYRFERISRHVDSTLWTRVKRDGSKLYSTHRFGFIRVRHADHTYIRGDESFYSNSTGYLRSGLDLDGSMI